MIKDPILKREYQRQWFAKNKERLPEYRITAACNLLMRNGYTVTKADHEQDEQRKAANDGTK